MYELYDKGNIWEIHIAGKGAYSGSFLKIMYFCVTRLGFKTEDLEEAIHWMVKENHNAAHFGVWKRFMWSFNREEKDGRKAG